MAKQTHNLSGSWELYWKTIGAGKIDEFKDNTCYENGISCSVPGDVHTAFTEAGIIKDPHNDINSKECRWLEEKEFWYVKDFYISDNFIRDYTEVVFEGLDLTADIWLNSQYIGGHNNAFIEKKINISAYIKAGENSLVVRIDEGVAAVKDKPIDFMEHSWNNEQPYRAWMRKPQYVYGWDWTIWLPTCGIWKDVYINSYEKAAIQNINVKTEYKGDEISRADMITFSVDTEIEIFRQSECTLKCNVYTDERFEKYKLISSKSCEITDSCTKTINLTIDKPTLWFPNGAGKPYLYKIVITLEDESSNVIYSITKKHGARTVKIREEALDETSKSFTFMINDEPIFAKGANHVPADILLGNITDEKNRSLMKAVADANMNMIRVWGGGIYESEGFMDACDELGIMVWHDFMFACAYYPDHIPEFFEEIRTEVTVAIKRLRNHSSLIGWSGNNEIQEMYTGAKTYNPDLYWYGGRLYEKLLPELVKKLCPDRIYRQSSPFGGNEPSSYDEGDQHTWHFTHRQTWEHYLDLWRFTDFDFKFLSEFGIIGAMDLESARKCISADKLKINSDEWLHHTNFCQDNKLLDIIVKKYFDVVDDTDIQDYILKSQVIQAEMMRHVYDELRSRKFRCSGVLLWTLSDSYGINNWSVIDYYLRKRPLYYYLKRSLAPINIAIIGYEVQNFDGMKCYKEYYKGKTKPIILIAENDTLQKQNVTIKYEIMTFGGVVLKSGSAEKILSKNSSEKVMDIDICDIKDTFNPKEAILYIQIEKDGVIVNENRYFFAPYKTLALKNADVKYSVNILSESSAELTFEADTFVWMLHISEDDNISLSDNDFDLLAEHKKTIIIEGENIKDYVPMLHSLNPKINNVGECYYD
jgi:beta-mannosidase